MILFFRSLLLISALFASIAAPQPSQAQGVLKNAFGDWQLRCEPAPGGREQCALVQNVASETRASVGLVIILVKNPDDDRFLLRVMAPLNVLLPRGLGLRIDQAEIGSAGFLRCNATGCFSEVTLDPGLLNQLRLGKIATFVIFMSPDEGVGFPINLNGIEAGLAALP
jgi:invasion protein IalB